MLFILTVQASARPSPEHPGRIRIGMDDGRPVAPSAYEGVGRAVKEVVSFEAPRRIRVDRIRFTAGGAAGMLTLHVWSDIDSTVRPYIPFRGFEFDVVAPIEMSVAASELDKWREVDLSALGREFILERGMRIHVGAIVSPDGTRFACDRAVGPTSRVEILDSAEDRVPVLFEPAGDFLVRLEGDAVPEDPAPRFADVTDSTGIPHIAGDSFAWADVDGDGWEDLLVNGHRLFRNIKGRRFTEISLMVPDRIASFGLFADVDNDGDLDLFIAAKGAGSPDRLLFNDGKGNFSARPGALPELSNYTCSGAWLDFDRDGWIDLFVANGTRRGTAGVPDADVLFQNRGNGVFGDVTRNFAMETRSFSHTATAADLNGDGSSELFVGTYRLEPDQLWDLSADLPVNIAAGSDLSGSGHALGANMADLDADGDLDLIVANLIHPDWRGLRSGQESWFFENLGDGRTIRRPLRELGITFEETISSPTIADFDNDGQLDLFHNSWYHSANLYMRRNGRFEDRTKSAGLNASQAMSSAACDFDRDGRIDLIVADKRSGLKLYRNTSKPRFWLGLKLVGTHCNGSAIGATARLRLGGKILTQTVSSGKGIGEQDSRILHFGMGDLQDPMEVEVSWPCGHRQRTKSLAPQSIHTVFEDMREGGM